MRKTWSLGFCLVILLTGCAGNLSTDRQFDDAILADRVREALWNDPDLARYQIGVAVHSGAVTLTGTVQSAADAAKAGRIAETIVDVQSVRNLITVGGMTGVIK
ncbi:MAG TPA: BON domain-containing protein [Thermoanaerobaculia bacterium]|nr:BON domain-containing protein [Thermoanaerobaculia bacterium]